MFTKSKNIATHNANIIYCHYNNQIINLMTINIINKFPMMLMKIVIWKNFILKMTLKNNCMN